MPRRVDIDWQQLEDVFTFQPVGAQAFLDLRTGKVISWSDDTMDTVELEGVADEIDQDPDRYVEIVVPESHASFEWMADFVRAVEPGALHDELARALEGRKPFRRFKDVLEGAPAARERWFEFELARQRQALRDWVAGEDLEPVTPPPW